MRNKKSVLMTLNHNYGCFSGVGGIAGNNPMWFLFQTKYILLFVSVERKVRKTAKALMEQKEFGTEELFNQFKKLNQK